MATPTQPSSIQINNTNTIKSAARKLPIKRKTPAQQPESQSQSSIDPPRINTIPIPNPNPIHPHSSAVTLPPPTAAAAYDDDYEDDEFDDESQDQDHDHDQEETNSFGGGADATISSSANGSSGDHLKPPPFKFHRIWSESDEIRFLQGLLGCWSQGLIFPRDLNLFYDRFSESMPQPYTRSQLSEKLRRLRKKFRTMSGRIARGQDPNRLAPHDRDLLHLCTRLWDTKYASSSPFLAPDPASSGVTVGNKRRRPNPRAPAASAAVAARPLKAEDAPPPPAPPAIPALSNEGNHLKLVTEKEEKDEEAPFMEEERPVVVVVVAPAPAPVPAAIIVADSSKNKEENNNIEYVTSKTVLDVFDGSLKELRVNLLAEGSSGSELLRRWQEQRIAELDVFARRLRLVLEQSLRN